jgi:myosin heavy subunit
VQENELESSLTTKTRIIVKEITKSPLEASECKAKRDTLAKALYEKLFDWLVLCMNKAIASRANLND